MDVLSLKADQLTRFRKGVSLLLERNAFYKAKLEAAGLRSSQDLQTMGDYASLPFTTKSELSADQEAHPPYGSNLTFDLESYVRVHQTSGTTGRSLYWLDTEKSWTWWGKCWNAVYEGAGVGARDRIFFAFSFGPFIGFWSAFEGARQLGAMALSGGAASTEQRLRAILDHRATVLVCTPTYALHLAGSARAMGIDLAGSDVRVTIHAGEPGASLPATRRRIEAEWGAACYDHPGATEVGAWGFECGERTGVHLNEDEFLFEVIDPSTGEACNDGELVISNLGRWGMPVVRYRTGDRVRLSSDVCSCGCGFRLLSGGVIGRLDDALIVRGVNVYPSAVENVIRRFDSIGEFAVSVRRKESMDEMEIRIEVEGPEGEAIAGRVSEEVRRALSLRAEVREVRVGTLPRFELKARRFVDDRE